MFVNMLAEKNPDLKVISQWIEKIRVGVIGKRATVAFKMTPQEIQKLNLKKSQVAKAEKTR
jgi:glutamate racemase